MILKIGLLGEQMKKSFKIAGNGGFLALCQSTGTKKTKTKTPQKEKKGRVNNTFLHLEQQSTIFD